MEAFLAWLDHGGVQRSAGWEICETGTAGRGLISTRTFQPGEPLFSVPRSTCLSPRTCPLPACIPTHELAGIPPWTHLILVLLYAQSQPAWSPYLSVLPRTFTTPIFWTPEELGQLKGSCVLDKIGREEAELSYHSVVRGFVERYPAVFVRELCGLDAFHRMGSLVMSCAFDGDSDSLDLDHDHDPALILEDGDAMDTASVSSSSSSSSSSTSSTTSASNEAATQMMVPLADLLNAEDESSTNAHLFHESTSLVMRTTKLIPPSSQIFNTYGPLPNADLLRRYGYVLFPGTPHDIIELQGPLITDLAGSGLDDLDKRDRITWLLDSGILDDSFDLGRDRKIPDEVLRCIETMMMTRHEFQLLKRGSRSGSGLVVDLRGSGGIKRCLLMILKKRGEMYPTSIEEDEALLLDGTLEGKKRMAIVVRLGEKQILRDVRGNVEGWEIHKGRKRGKEGTGSSSLGSVKSGSGSAKGGSRKKMKR